MSNPKPSKKRRQSARTKPTKTNPHIVEKRGLPVYTGPVCGDLTRAVEEDREERSRVIWGGDPAGR